MARSAFALGMVFVCATALAQVPSTWYEPSTPKQQAALAAQPDYQRFLSAASGKWQADFDPVLRTPRAIWGSGLELFPADANQNRVEHDALKFLDDNASLFGGTRGDFAIDDALQSGDLWFLSATQRYRGVVVAGSQLSLTIKRGRLILIQGFSHRVTDIDPMPRFGSDHAIAAAMRHNGLGNRRAGKEKDSDDARLLILPQRSPGAVNYRLAWEVRSHREGEANAMDRYIVSFVDAAGGDVLASYDGNQYAYLGTASIETQVRTAVDPPLTVPAPFLDMSVGGQFIRADVAGNFSTPSFGVPTGISASMRGRLAQVVNRGGGQASFFGLINENSPFTLLWNDSNSDPSERMTYRAVSETNRFLKTVFPTVGGLERALLANVNASGVCNGFFDGRSINLLRASPSCFAPGRNYDVVAHEFGHYFDAIAPGGLQDGGLSEFIGDLVVFTQTDDPLIGRHFFTSGDGAVRDLNSPFYQCFNPLFTEEHDRGQLLGEVVWDIREDLKAAGVTGMDLRRLMLLPVANSQFFSTWYRGMLAVDDDDGDLANGTPHECLILNEFVQHSCGGTRWPGIPPHAPVRCGGDNHVPVANAGPDQIFGCDVLPVEVTLDATASFDDDGDFLTFQWSTPFGTIFGPIVQFTLTAPVEYDFTVNVTDGADTATDTVHVAVRDTDGPVITAASVNPSILWPPNHQMVPISAIAQAEDSCSPNVSCRVTAVTSNEPENGLGDGDQSPDWSIDGDSLLLRAERSGTGTGRVYTLTLTCTDSSGNPSTRTLTVTVPKNKS